MVNSKQVLKKKKQGQSTLEYIILVAGVIAILIVFVGGNNSVFKTAFNSTLSQGTKSMNKLGVRLANSY